MAFPPKNSHMFIIWVYHPLNMARIHWKSPNQLWIPRITINLSLKPPSSNSVTWNHHYQPSSISFVTWSHYHHQPSLKTHLCHLKAVFCVCVCVCVCEKVFALSIYVLIYNFTICLLAGSGSRGHNVFVCFCMLLLIMVHMFPMFSVFNMRPCWRELSMLNSIVWGFFV